MEQILVLNPIASPARTHAQQLKVIMNLPVRLISEDQIIDVVPLPEPYIAPSQKRILKLGNTKPHVVNYTPDQLIDFFRGAHYGDFLTTREVAYRYDVSTTTINAWSAKGFLKRYILTQSLTLYKRDELPAIETLYGDL